MYLEDTHTTFYDGQGPVILNACTYLHNYSYDPDDVIFSPKFKEALMNCPLFTADDSDEVGSAEYIREYAEKSGCNILEYDLEIQFRCGGSEAFVNWIDNTLSIKRTPNILWTKGEVFDFKIIDRPENLEKAIEDKIRGGGSRRG